MPIRSLVVAALVVIASACSGGGGTGTGGGAGGGNGTTFGCSDVPTCYSDALTALKACVPSPTLTLGTVTANSGVIDGLRCTGSTTVSFSAFSERPSGTVPLPSGVTLTTSGTTCAVLGSGSGTTTDRNGATRRFTFSTVKIGTAEPVQVTTYEDGSFGIECPGSRDEVTAAAGSLDTCPTALVRPKVVRSDPVTHMGVDLVDVGGTATALFTCD